MTTKLPVVGTSAATTSFCAVKLEGPDGYLWIDGNQKITAGNGSYADPKPNAFSLEAQAVVDREEIDRQGDVISERTHCPGSTAVCRSSCYVHGLEKHASDTYALYRHNSREIRRILSNPTDGMNWLAIEWGEVFAKWINENAQGGFRWHVSGDIFSAAYARWIAFVVSRSVDADHWIYTRSFGKGLETVLDPLLDLDNLALNLSCDRENYTAAVLYKAAVESRQMSTPVQLCYLTDDGALPADLPIGSVIFPDYNLRGRGLADPTDSPWWQGLTNEQRAMTCPVDFFGKSPNLRCGPCRKCLL